jgi:hypothetical protein
MSYESERVAQIQAHRAIRGVEHDGTTGKFHGDCYVCGVPFPCEYVGAPPRPQAVAQGLDANTVILAAVREAQAVVLGWLLPDSTVTAEAAMTALLPILDNKTLVLAMREVEGGAV